MMNKRDDAVFQEVQLFELVGALAFTTNKSFWNVDEKDHMILKGIREGSLSIKLDVDQMSQSLSKFFVGLFIFAFYIYENIGRPYLTAFKKNNTSIVNVKFFDGESLTFDVHKFDDSMKKFFDKTLMVLFGLTYPEINAEIFSRLSRMFKASYQRLQKETVFLKEILSEQDLYLRLVDSESLNINFVALVLTAMPQNYLNSMFMLAANCLETDFEVQTVNGISINAKPYFFYDTVDMNELYNKIKLFVAIYQNDKDVFCATFFHQDMQEYFRLVFAGPAITPKIKASISDTLDGQFVPRLDTIKAFCKLIG